jgi:phytoene/squalene synthetase
MTENTARIAREITRVSSKQTYYTVRLLVDSNLEEDCHRAYAYFRWVDDCIDELDRTQDERITFIDRQSQLVDQLYKGTRPSDLCPEENIVADLIQHNQDGHSRLRSYIDNFMAILKFDAQRKNRQISQSELNWYSDKLGKAVTDCIQHFIHNGHDYPNAENQYLAATAAHITHMLRDMREDLLNGFINIPREYLEQFNLDPEDMDSPHFKDWVRQRVETARKYFYEGKGYLDKLEVLRCKIAGYWYCARFERILDTIERDGYALRKGYAKGNRLFAWLVMARISLSVSLQHLFQRRQLI